MDLKKSELLKNILNMFLTIVSADWCVSKDYFLILPFVAGQSFAKLNASFENSK